MGLALYGASLAMMVRGALGLSPWDVLHSGFIRHVPMTIGQAVVLLSFVVLLLWIPLREKPGIGTVANALLVGLAADATLAVLVEPDSLAFRLALMLGGTRPQRAGHGALHRLPVRPGAARRADDGHRASDRAVAAAGAHRARGHRRGDRPAPRGALGVGTVLYALAIGPLAQLMLPWWTVELARGPEPRATRNDSTAPLIARDTHAPQPGKSRGSPESSHTSSPRNRLPMSPVGTPPAGVETSGLA